MARSPSWPVVASRMSVRADAPIPSPITKMTFLAVCSRSSPPEPPELVTPRARATAANATTLATSAARHGLRDNAVNCMV